MGKNSREKRLRRLELARIGGTPEDYAKELGKWNASWLLPCAVTVLVTWIAAGSGIEMIPLLAVIWLGFAISTLVIWLLTNVANHRAMKFALTIVFWGISIVASIWTYRKDRPIIDPLIGGVVTQGYNREWLALDVEADIQNSGRQASYAKKWDLELDIRGKRFQGRQLFGEELPKGTLKLAELRDQEFPVGKAVSGWLFFAFPDVLHIDFERYSLCDTKVANEVNITLTVTDSKEERNFSQTRNLADLLRERCNTLEPGAKQP
jgi:hypothetical protein